MLLHDEGEGAYVSDVPDASPAAGTEEGASDGEASEVDISSDEEDDLPKRCALDPPQVTLGWKSLGNDCASLPSGAGG